MNIIGIIQARMNSVRFPNKMMASIGKYEVIDWVLRRSKCSKLISKLILATSSNTENDYLINKAKKNSIEYFRGSEDDVLSRFVIIAKKEKADIIVRICADNPFISPIEIDRAIKFFIDKNPDYVFNHIPALRNNYVDGVGAEVIGNKTLSKINENARIPEHREHITKYIWDNKNEFDIKTILAPKSLQYPKVRLDIDSKNDLFFLNNLLKKINHNSNPESLNVKKLLDDIHLC